jgi:hypothetical protein
VPASALTVDRVIICLCLCLDCWPCNYLSLQITYFEYLNIQVENNLLIRSHMHARLQIWNTDIVKKYAQLDRLLLLEGNFGRHSVSEHFYNLFAVQQKWFSCFPLFWHVVYCFFHISVEGYSVHAFPPIKYLWTKGFPHELKNGSIFRMFCAWKQVIWRK